jgi:hypothetical protein
LLEGSSPPTEMSRHPWNVKTLSERRATTKSLVREDDVHAARQRMPSGKISMRLIWHSGGSPIAARTSLTSFTGLGRTPSAASRSCSAANRSVSSCAVRFSATTAIIRAARSGTGSRAPFRRAFPRAQDARSRHAGRRSQARYKVSSGASFKLSDELFEIGGDADGSLARFEPESEAGWRLWKLCAGSG